jgi:GH35 family endo-1,4-beta-xylanase
MNMRKLLLTLVLLVTAAWAQKPAEPEYAQSVLIHDGFEVNYDGWHAPQPAPNDDVGLKDIYADYFIFGSIFSGTTINDNNMKQLVLKEFNSITPENELKPDATLVQSGSTNADIKVNLNNGAKAILKFCEDNNIPVRGHTLVWHSQTPQWFFKDNFQNGGNWVTPAVMDQRMESYIKNMFNLITTSYPKLNLYAYDVVNEVASENGSYRTAGSDASSGQSMWVQVYGNNSFVEKAFTYARQYAPANTKLYYNDYNEYIAAKRDYIANSIVKPLYQKGLLDGMGMQSHLDVRGGGTNVYPSATLYGQAVKLYKDIGVDIQITELDATVDNSNWVAQAVYYRDIMKAIINNGGSSVKAVVVWGIQDNQSWRKDRNPLLFNSSGAKKEAYDSVAVVAQTVAPPPKSSSSAGNISSSSSRPSSSSVAASSSSSSSSSSSVTSGAQTCDYQAAFCGGMAYADVLGNSAAMPTEGQCLFIEDFDIIQPNLESTVSINGEDNVCGEEWESCGYNTKPSTKKDGGYYVYVKEGAVNSYEDNGWQGVVAKEKPDCSNGPTPILHSKFPILNSELPVYYTLKGKPLGHAKPKEAGVYIVKEGYSVRKIVVR